MVGIHSSFQRPNLLKKIAIVFLMLALILFTFSFFESLNSNPSYLGISILALASLIIEIALLLWIGHRLASFLVLFVAFYYLFHFGQVFMLGFFPDYEYAYINYIKLYMTDSKLVNETLLICLNCIHCFVLGAVLLSRANPSFERKHLYRRRREISHKNVGKVLFLFTLPFKFFFDFKGLFLSFFGTYSSTFATFRGEGIISALSMICSVAAIMFLLELPRKKDKKFLIVSVIYLCVMMLSGGRGRQLIAIIGLLIAFFAKYKNKITFKKVLFTIVLSYFLLVLVDMVFELRELGVSFFLENFPEYFVNSLKTNILFETIGSFGETVFTPYLVLKGYGTTYQPYFGETFFKGLLSIAPDFFGYLSDINKEAVFVNIVNEGHKIGGSFVGDLYYAWGSAYWVFAILIGGIYSTCSYRFTFRVENGYRYSSYLYIVFLGLSLWWIRDSFSGMIRNFVWGCVLLLLVSSIMKKNTIYGSGDLPAVSPSGEKRFWLTVGGHNG